VTAAVLVVVVVVVVNVSVGNISERVGDVVVDVVDVESSR
jgi:hypothetical protein